jgi:hypothetical protein
MKKLIFMLFCALVASNVFAQQIIVFNDSTNSSSNTRTITHDEEKNIVSWNISMLARGALLFEYERKVNDYLNILGGAGITYYNPITEFMNFVSDNNKSGETYKVGYVFEGGLKYFPKEMDGWDGFFIAPIYRYRHYVKSFDNGGTNLNLNTNSNDFLFVFGWQYELWSEIVTSTYLGVGYSRGSRQTFEHSNSNTYELVTSKTNASLITLGFTLGVPF